MPSPRFAVASGAAIDVKEQRISADSHMAEPPDLWEKRLPSKFRDRALQFPDQRLYETNQHLRAGGWHPQERLKDLALDGISAEVLYATLAKRGWTGEPAFEEACFRVYNDWLIEFCSVAPERFWGLCLLSYYEIDHAVKELERCQQAGMHGVFMPVAPDPEYPYSALHYEPLWEAAEALDMPVSMHINSGLGWPGKSTRRTGHLPDGVHKIDCQKAVGDMVATGVFERHPNLKVVVAEAGVGWIPFFAQEFDQYIDMIKDAKLSMPPSAYVWRNVYGAFISDKVGCTLLPTYGVDNFMWSNDYPHPACIWPGASGVIAHDLGHLSPEDREKVICTNVARLYNGGRLPPPPDPVPEEFQEIDETWLKWHQPTVTTMA